MSELFRDFWWLIFPIFGMFMAVWGSAYSERRSRNVIDLIKSYTDQGKEPPAELLRLVSRSLTEDERTPDDRRNSGAWSFVTFAAVGAGFSVGYYFVRDQNWAWAFAIVAVTMWIMAIGALVILLTGRK